MLFFVGTYTRLGGPGIALCRLDGRGLRLLSAQAELANPTYVILSRDGHSLFAAGADPETGEGLAASYAVKGEGLRLTGRAHTGGKAACHLTLDPAERHLYATNYLSGSVAMFPVESGRVGQRQQLLCHEGRGPNPGRQEGPHTHQARFRPGGSELFVCDLGIDAVVVYAQDPETGALSRQASVPVEPGAGPRHLVFSSPDRFYLACELDSTVRVYQRDCQGFACAQALSTLPEGWAGENTASAIRLFRGHLYAMTASRPLRCKRTGGSCRSA